jgi:hypothetical protein
MWAWIYLPERLPKAYNKWIASAAAVDSRLVLALRHARWGEFVYGKETGQARILTPMCKDYGWPLHWGDPKVTVPIPCEIVHMGTGPNCEYCIANRFLRSFVWALATYLPLNLVLRLRKPSVKGAWTALVSSVRSSSFLASFIALFYYGICLARTRLPQLYLLLQQARNKPAEISVKARQVIDSGLCVASGCLLCGWSILLENKTRREDIALFVAPRALATLLPRRYAKEKEWRERLIFASSSAVVFTCIGENPTRVRGVLGKLLRSVMN